MDGLANYTWIVTMVLIYIPTIYVCVSNFFKSLDSDNKGLGLRSLFTILIPFPIIQTMFNFVALRIIPRRYKSKILSIIKPTYVASVEDDQETSNGRKLKIDEEKAMKEIFEVEDMKADLKTAGTFYNSCPSICLQVSIIFIIAFFIFRIIIIIVICIQVVIIIMFPDRTISWLQITSITVSSFMTLWTAANLYQLQLEEATKRELENEKKRWAKEKSGTDPKQKWSEKLKNAFV